MTEPRTRRRVLAAVGTGLTGSVAGCMGAFAHGEYDIGMRTQAFAPETLRVDAGTTVVWKNTSTRGHTVTAYEDTLPEEATYFASGGFESEAAARKAWTSDNEGLVLTSETYSHTFEIPGNYGYVCLPHEEGGMIGTIIVE
ncbi:MAG: plastocyanin/azurin family copper-binding protein [Halonotius sp.]